jgi:hypothetical protein
VAVILAAGGLGGCMSTPTYGTGESPELAIFREVTGGIPLVGAKKKSEPIEIQPRAPLVLPPSATALAPPIETAAVTNPQWPKQPEKGARGEGSPGFDGDQERNQITSADYNRLKPLGELNGPRKRRQEPSSDFESRPRVLVNGAEQRKTFQAAINEAEGVGRTERRYLTEPPEVYREPAATAPGEFDTIKKKRGGLTGWLLGS